MTENHPKHRPIRSFVRREGRITPAQARALEQLLPTYGLDTEHGVADLDTLFGRQAPRYLEIGFGSGGALLEMAATHPERDYIGIDVHRPGVGSLLLRLQQANVGNVRIGCTDAVEVLAENLPDHSLDGVYLFFPDPWHKKKHHKRRIVQPTFAQLLAHKLKPGGQVHMATDWQDYAEHMLTVMSAQENFTNTAGVGCYAERGERPLTKYEQRGQRLGHAVWDLVFEYRPGES